MKNRVNEKESLSPFVLSLAGGLVVTIVVAILYLATKAPGCINSEKDNHHHHMMSSKMCHNSDKVEVSSGAQTHLWPIPPPHTEYAKVARYIVHISDWASLATYSTHEGIEGFPFNNIFSVSDGPIDNCTGVPYFYISEWELSAKDLMKDNRATVVLSEAQSSYCKQKSYDPEDPRCAHVILTGTFERLNVSSKEEDFARKALFLRHPEMPAWPIDHHWFFAKLNVTHIYLLDYFGGAKVVDVQEYLDSNPF